MNVFIAKDGAIRVNATPSSLDALTHDVAAQAATPDKNRQPVRLHAPENVPYERLMAVLNRLQEAGWFKVGLINEPEAAR